MIYIQNLILLFIATLIAAVIYLIDLNTDSTLAVSSLYALVILYSWLLPGKYASIYAASFCTGLILLSVALSTDVNTTFSDLSNMNVVISMVNVWISVILVFIAKNSFISLEATNHKLALTSDQLLQKVKKLNEQQQELSRHRSELEKLNQNLLIKNRELERFTSIASHDLQEPLRTIGNMTHLIHDRYYPTFDDEGKKILNYVTSATDRMSRLIKGLLDFSRIGIKRELTEVDCHELVNNIILDFDTALKATNGTIKTTSLPLVKGNPSELRILFQNLISNALKFKDADCTPTVEIYSQESNNHFQFCVKDNGIGIDETNFQKIFLIFQRLHHLKDYEGTGLGLAYCRKVVDLHNGNIWVESKRGEGSSFYFTIKKEI